MGFPHADAEAFQVDFTHGTLGNDAVVITVCEELHLVAVCRAPYTRLLILVTNARPRAIARGSKGNTA